MSLDALEKFYEHVRNDKTLEQEATAALQEGASAVVKLGEREGFSFTTEELTVALAHHAATNDELSDDELELVAGGMLIPSYKREAKGERITIGY